jgi:hypothetical protein
VADASFPWPSEYGAFARNEAILLLNLLAYEIVHAGRRLMVPDKRGAP